MKRLSGTQPGYNCGPRGAGCEHEQKGDHGISGGVWWYTVTEGDRAVSLSVLATDYPASVARPLPAIIEKPLAADLAYHRADPEGKECPWVRGGRCTNDGSALGARGFWAEHGHDAQHEQPESFWLALEAELKEFTGP